jgi:5-methylcytosine-specific restriction protein A
MTRAVPEWIADHDDQAIPPRVRLRVWDQFDGRCALCVRRLFPSDKWQCDHIVALVNGGEHRERNLRLLCDWCHKEKTASDVAQKSKDRRKRAKHVGIKKPGRKIPGSKGTGIRKPINGPAYRVNE